MESKPILNISQLSLRLNKTISDIFVLALSQQLQLWMDFGEVEIYEKDNNGKIQIISEMSQAPINPTSDLLRAFLYCQEKGFDCWDDDEGYVWQLSLTEFEKRRVVKEEGKTGLARWYSTTFDTSPTLATEEDGSHQLIFTTLPAILEDNKHVLLKKIDRVQLRAEERQYHIHSLFVLEPNNLFAYEDDVKKFECAPSDDYFIGKDRIAWLLDLKLKPKTNPTNAIKYQLKQAGISREYETEHPHRLKLKKTDYLKIVNRKMKKKFKE